MTFSFQKTLTALTFASTLMLVNSASAQTRPKLPTPSPSPQEITPAAQDKVATRSTWSFLPLEAAGVETFWKSHPNADGRGTIVVILDTGVDPTIEGLLTTSEGKQKIIDVQDFSGSGDVLYSEARKSGDELLYKDKPVLKGLSGVNLKSWDGKYYYAVLPERRFANGKGDLNFNSTETDNFGIYLVEDSPGHFVAVVDSDGDGDLTGEKIITTYHEKFDTFGFHAASEKLGESSEGKRLGAAINIFPAEQRVSVYFDDGSHGTHVAGIAAGHDIDRQKGFNGIAPGAELVGIKFADNSIGGITVSGSMKRGYEYAAKLARTSNKPVVVNMSFGIGSEIEAQSEMDIWLDSLLAATPELTVCVSAGNDGPGLSSVGLPGTANRVISSGATLPDDAARDLYGVYAREPILWDFSSRGGEVAKPDFLTPGTAVSTVPDYVSGDRYNGTSMASPFSAGCCAVLLSAMKQTFADYKPNAFELRRAMMLSADHLAGQTPLDEGFGMLNVPHAFDLLADWHRKGESPVEYSIVTNVPNATGKATSAYFRTGLYPKDGERQTFVIRPTGTGKTAREKALGMKAYDLISDAAWLVPVQSSTYRRGEGSFNIDVRYDEKLLKTPGLYTGRIWGFEKGDKHLRSNSKFELLSSIIIPHQLDASNDFKVELSNLKLPGEEVHREFIRIPAGTRAVRMVMAGGGQRSNVTARIFNDDGREFAGTSLKTGVAVKPSVLYLTGEEVNPGVWEVDFRRGLHSIDEKEPEIDFSIEAFPLDYSVSTQATPGSAPRAHVVLTNQSNRELSIMGDAEIPGYEHVLDTVVQTSDVFMMPITPRDRESGAEYSIELPREDYNLFTDISCQIIRPDSSTLYNSAFDLRDKDFKILFDGDSNETYMLRIQGGLANPDKEHPWRIRIRERRTLRSAIGLKMDPSRAEMSPLQTVSTDLVGTRALPELPAGHNFYGTLRLQHDPDSKILLPITF